MNDDPENDEREEPGCFMVGFYTVFAILVAFIIWQSIELYQKVTHDIPEVINEVSTK